LLAGPLYAGFVEPYTEMDSATDVDFHVFRTGAASTLDDTFIILCWGAVDDILDGYLYRVIDGQQGPLVVEAATPTEGCEPVVPFGEGADILQPDTVYLLELRAANPVPPLPYGYVA
jgi:hypothetical protein